MYDMSPFCATLWAEAHFSSDCEIQLGFTGGKRTCLPMQETQEMRVRSLGWEDTLEEAWQPIPVFFPGKSQGQRSLAGYGP